MNSPVNQISITAEQLNRAVETYLNEHVFREPVRVAAVKSRYDEGAPATIELAAETSEAPIADR